MEAGPVALEALSVCSCGCMIYPVQCRTFVTEARELSTSLAALHQGNRRLAKKNLFNTVATNWYIQLQMSLDCGLWIFCFSSNIFDIDRAQEIHKGKSCKLDSVIMKKLDEVKGN